ncbi:MAG: alpha/beta fold hydrolase [Desulfobacterales bacterium]
MEKIQTDKYGSLDRLLHAFQGRFTLSISPGALMLAYYDWMTHLSNSPGKQLELAELFFEQLTRHGGYLVKSTLNPDCKPCIDVEETDNRFEGPEWQKPPFNYIYQPFLLAQEWWKRATSDVSGATGHHLDVVSFVARQVLDVFSPSNFILTNPEVLNTTLEEGGMNLVKGARNLIEDLLRNIDGQPPAGAEDFEPGKNMALTAGKVIYRNDLMELIQYQPQTEEVYTEPILIIPAWIMKYYILDINPQKSLVNYLVGKGYTVFMISWKNPDHDDHDKGLEDYMKKGALEAFNVVSAVVPEQKIHAVGYCLGGTLLAMTCALMAREGDSRLKTLTLLAAQTDFSEPGELELFIDESQVSYLEDQMWFQGYLDTKQMSGAFQLLRSNDLIWSRMVHDYLMGKRQEMFDLMAWNADTTRMPYKMHSEYLRKLFLQKEFSKGIFEVDGKPIVISDIYEPAFLVSTIKDHVSPWPSVYRFNLASDSREVTFLLTSGGHNAGIISEPGHPRRTYQVNTRKEGELYIAPDTFRKKMPVQKGSWWPVWHNWLVAYSDGKTQPPTMGAPEKDIVPLEDAPGTYVFG